MRRIWLLALNDLRLTARDRAAFVWMLLMPIAMMWFFSMIGGGGSSDSPRATLTVIDHDRGWLARALIDELSAEPSIRLRELTVDEAATAEDKVRTLIVPAGFTLEVLAGRQQTLLLQKDAGSDEAYGMAAQVHLTRWIVRTLGRLAEMDLGVDERPAFDALGQREPLVAVEVSSAGRGRPVPTGTAQSVPGNLTFVVMMMTLIYGGVFLTIEKQTGMLRRQAGLPMSRRALFLGKLLGRMLMAGVQIVILVLAGRWLFGLHWGNSIVGLVLMLVSYAAAVGGLATLLGALLRTPEQASSVGWIVSMVLAALGGCWWPSEVMPGWMNSVAHALPTAWAMDGFHALISFGHGISAVLPSVAALLAFSLVFVVLGARWLRFD
jgi:ABC-2 type transport system permease protein